MDNSDLRADFISAVREIAGEEALTQLIDAVGGTTIWLPQKSFIGNWFTKIVGLEEGQKIIDRVKAFDANGRSVATTLYIPLGQNTELAIRVAKVRDLAAQGMGTREIARTIGITERTVRSLATKKIKVPSGIDKPKKACKPRIGVLELAIIEGNSDTLIVAKTGATLRQIELRRRGLRKAGLLNTNGPVRNACDVIVEPSPDHPANIGKMVPPSDEVP